jgi:hypothetical protein
LLCKKELDRWSAIRQPKRREGVSQGLENRLSGRAAAIGGGRKVWVQFVNGIFTLDRYSPLCAGKVHKWRHLIENFFCKIKEFRHIATPCDNTDTSFAVKIVPPSMLLSSELRQSEGSAYG